MNSGERIRALMKEKDLSQAELARRIGVSQPTIFKLLKGGKKGSAHLHKVARELGTSTAYLACETDDPHAEGPELTLSSEERECLELMRDCVDAERAAVMTLLRSISRLRVAG